MSNPSSGLANADGRASLTAAGKAMAMELHYGHNPRAYLCRERSGGQQFGAGELCVICSDGFEAVAWKRRATELEASVLRLAAELETESGDPSIAARIRAVIR